MNGIGNRRRMIKEFACEKCNGTGHVSEFTHTNYPCERCKGKRYITVHEIDSFYEQDIPCPVCGGTGGLGSSTYTLKRCDVCGGTGIGIK